MSPDDVDSIILKLSDKLKAVFDIDFDNDVNYNFLAAEITELLDPFLTKDRNYN